MILCIWITGKWRIE